MKHLFTLSGVLLCFALSAQQTQPEIGTPAWLAQHQQQQAQQRIAHPVITPQNGNDTLTRLYDSTMCGLNYTYGSQRLGQRFSPIGAAQPAAIAINNIPPCAIVDKAYLWTEALGVAPSITATIVNPASTSTPYAMSLIGSSVDVCWGMNGTHMWRADVTSCIVGNGNYVLSGLPTSLTSSTGVDVEGATLMVIYHDPSASYTGTLLIDDGCHTVTGGTLQHTMTGFSACANSSAGNAFMFVGDMQMPGYMLSMNGNAVAQPQWNWWNQISASTSVTNGQSSCGYSITSGNDCFTLGVAGLYFQTNCNNCSPMSSNISLTTSSTADNCNGNGTASVVATGGSGTYTYLWSPAGQTTSTATGLPGGTYTVSVSDGNSCTSATVAVAYTGMTISSSTTPVTCNALGSASVSVTGGQSPYTYSWAPSGGTGATANNLAPGTYTCTITDNGGCAMTVIDTVGNNASLAVQVVTTDDSCPSPSGAAYAVVSGGQTPYTYLWSPGGQTTSSITNIAAGSYTVTVSDNAGCVVSASDTVHTSNTPFSVYASSPNWGYYICGDTVQLNATSNYPSITTYSWSPATYLNNPNIANPVGTPIGTLTYTVTATSVCGTDTASITVYPDTLNYYNEDICFVTVDTSVNKFLIVWERNNSPSSGTYDLYKETSTAGVYAPLASQPVAQFTTYLDVASNPIVMAERYELGITDTCGNPGYQLSPHHRPVHLQTSAAMLGGWNLSWTQYEGLPIATYNIYRGSALNNLTLLTSVAGTVFTYTDITPPSPPVYYLVEAVHPFGGCSPSLRTFNGSQAQHLTNMLNPISNIATASPDGVNEQQTLTSSFSILPNPTDGQFNLSFLTNRGTATVNVFDALGRVVYAEQINSANGLVNHSMDLRSLAAGVYTVRLQTQDGSAQQRLVISR